LDWTQEENLEKIEFVTILEIAFPMELYVASRTSLIAKFAMVYGNLLSDELSVKIKMVFKAKKFP